MLYVRVYMISLAYFVHDGFFYISVGTGFLLAVQAELGVQFFCFIRQKLQFLASI